METRLGLEWELWAVAQLAGGASADAVVATLVGDGLASDVARAKVDELFASPSFQQLRRDHVRGAMAEQLVRARHDRVERIDRMATIGTDEFHERYWQRSRPVLLTEAARAMRAVRTWSFGTLAERFGDVEIEINVRRTEATRSSDTEAHAGRGTFGEFLRRAATTAGNDTYIVSRNGLLAHPELRPLWDDLAPLPAILAPPQPPRGASLWIGPAGTRSPAHFDPHGVLLVQVQGEKRVRLVAPDHLDMFERLDGYYATRALDDRALDITIGPGDALFVPLAWFHEVTSLAPSITLSLLCFPWSNDFHWFEPR